MEFTQVVRDIKRGHIAPIYVLLGHERYLVDTLVGQLKEQILTGPAGELNLQVLDEQAFDLVDILAAARQMPVFAEQRLVVARIDRWLQGREARENGEQLAELLAYLREPSPSTCLVLLATEWDRRKQLPRKLQEHAVVVECHALSPQDAVAWLKAQARRTDIGLTDDAARLLVAMAGTDLQGLRQEWEKLLAYTAATGTIDEGAVRTLAAQSAPLRIFDLLDTVLDQANDAAMTELRRHLEAGEPPLRIVAMLTRQIRLLLQVQLMLQRGLTADAIRKQLKLHPFVVRKALPQARRFSITRLERALAACVDTETALKSGRWPEDVGLDLLVARLVSAEAATPTG